MGERAVKRLVIAAAAVGYLAFLALVAAAVVTSAGRLSDKLVMGAFWLAVFVLVPLGAGIAVLLEKARGDGDRG